MRKCIIVYIFSTRMLVMHVEIAELIGGIRWSQAGGMRMCFSSMIIVQLSGKDSMKPSWGVGVCFFLQDRPIDRGIRWSRADEAGKKQIINQTSPHILYKCINLASHNNFIVCWLSRPTHHFVRSTCWNNTHCLATWLYFSFIFHDNCQLTYPEDCSASFSRSKWKKWRMNDWLILTSYPSL